MVEYGNAYPRNEDQYLASPFFLHKPTNTHLSYFIHSQNHTIQNHVLFKHDDLLFYFIFKHDDLYNEN